MLKNLVLIKNTTAFNEVMSNLVQIPTRLVSSVLFAIVLTPKHQHNEVYQMFIQLLITMRAGIYILQNTCLSLREKIKLDEVLQQPNKIPFGIKVLDKKKFDEENDNQSYLVLLDLCEHIRDHGCSNQIADEVALRFFDPSRIADEVYSLRQMKKKLPVYLNIKPTDS